MACSVSSTNAALPDVIGHVAELRSSRSSFVSVGEVPTLTFSSFRLPNYSLVLSLLLKSSVLVLSGCDVVEGDLSRLLAVSSRLGKGGLVSLSLSLSISGQATRNVLRCSSLLSWLHFNRNWGRSIRTLT